MKTKNGEIDEEEFKTNVAKYKDEELATIYGVEKRSIWRWRQALGIHNKKYAPMKGLDVEAFKKDVEILPNTEVARKHSISLKSVSKLRKRLGIANVWKRQLLNEDEFKKDCEEKRWYDVVEERGIARSTLNRWKLKMGLTNGRQPNRKILWKEDANGCWICTSHSTSNGYPQGGTSSGRGDLAKVVWSEKKGEIWPEGKVMIHSCDNRLCVNPEHVSPGSMKENQREMAEKDRSPWGSRSGQVRVSAEDVRKIYSLKGTGISQNVCGKMFGVGGSYVWMIWHGGARWRDVQGKENFPVKLTKSVDGKKLRFSEVESMRSMKGRVTTREVAKMYGVSQQLVSKIWSGKAWKDAR